MGLLQSSRRTETTDSPQTLHSSSETGEISPKFSCRTPKHIPEDSPQLLLLGGSTLAHAPSLRSSPISSDPLVGRACSISPYPPRSPGDPSKGGACPGCIPQSGHLPPTLGDTSEGETTLMDPSLGAPPNPESTSGDRSAPNSRDTGNTLETPGGWGDLPQGAALTQGPPAPPGYPSENTTHPSLHPCLRGSPDRQGSLGGGASASLHLSHGVGAAETLGDPS